MLKQRTSEVSWTHCPSTKNLYWCSPSGKSRIATKSLWLWRKNKALLMKISAFTQMTQTSLHVNSIKGNTNAIPFIQRYLCAPVIKRSRYVDLLPRSSPTNDCGSSLRTSLYQIVQIWGEFLLSRNLERSHHCPCEGLLMEWCRVLQQYLGLRPVGVEDVGVISAVYHLAAGFVVFVTTAVRAVGLGSMAICSHPITCITHNASPLSITEKDDNCW